MRKEKRQLYSYTKFFGIFFLALFLSGCTQSQEIQVPKINETQYQYSAPWDLKLYESFYKNIQDPGDIGIIHGGIIPHHLIAGHLDASFFESLKKQNPSTIILIGPNHFDRGYAPIITTKRDWKTLYGITHTNMEIVEELEKQQILTAEEGVIAEEHSVYSLIPFITKSLPNATVVPLILKNGITEEKMDELISNVLEIVPQDTVFVSSIDFSHYQTVPVAEFHDELSISAIKNFDFDRLEQLEIDSTPSLYVLLKIMEAKQAEQVGYELHTNSGLIVKSPGAQNTTSHYAPYFVAGVATDEQITSLLYLGSLPEDKKTREAVFEQLSGEEERFFSGMDYVLYTSNGGLQAFKRPQKNFVEISKFFETYLIPQDFHNLISEASIGLQQDGYALGIVWYPTHVSLYVFPIRKEGGMVELMEYDEAQKYFKKLIDSNGLGDYTFDNLLHIDFNI